MKLLLTTLSLAALLVLSGCINPQVKTTVAVPHRAPVVKPEEVRVVKRDQPAPGPYEILGVVGSRTVASKKKVLTLMKREAAQMGADALLGYFTDDDRQASGAFWAAALAVRLAAASSPDATNRRPVVVAVPWPTFENPTTSTSSKSPERACQRFAEAMLIAKGYYPLSLKAPLPMTLSELKLLPEAELQACGTADADQILLVNHTGTSRRYYLIVNSRADTFEAVLFAKRTREAVWQESAEGWSSDGFIMGGFTGIFYPNRGRMLRTGAAFHQMMETLPVVTTSTRQWNSR